MTHLLHDHIAEQLARRLADRRVVVWYDPRAEYEGFVAELQGEETGPGMRRCTIDGVEATVATDDGSLYSLRHRVEPLVAGDTPEPVVVYVAGRKRDRQGSILMELELAGTTWEQPLRQVARQALRQRYTDGVVDDLLTGDVLDYAELAKAASLKGGTDPSLLRSVLVDRSPDDQLARWLADGRLDAKIAEKSATDELGKLVTARLGIELPDGDLPKWRSITVRYVLGVEFRSDLAGDPPPELAALPAATAEVKQGARRIAKCLRDNYAEAYPDLSDRVAAELHLQPGSVDPLLLGAIDTFRFEEAALLGRCGQLVCEGRYDDVQEIADGRADSFWLHEQIERRTQWEAIRRAAVLGATAQEVVRELTPAPSTVSGWVERYADRWHRLDRAQRDLETWLPKLEDDADEAAIAHVRHQYDDVLAKLSSGFVGALEAASWSTDGIFRQTSVFDDLVRPTKARVAYFLVDAMRYEMGVDLAERLEANAEVTIKPALGILPSITTTGMAALMPGASAAYDVVDHGGKLLALVDGTPLGDLKARKKHLAARVPASVDLDLATVNGLSKAQLAKKVDGADLVVVRSQEIDLFGEGGFQARAVMDTIIENLARAVRKLAALGIERAVIASDHGHLYASSERDESMRIDAPGGDTVELHRRCWVGRGGTSPSASVRVSARSLGNDSDLDFCFPRGIGVFRSGGDLAFHHGGASPQEVIIPVITVRSPSASSAPSADGGLSLAVGALPEVITNRIFTVKVSLASLLGAGVPVRPVLLSDGVEVGKVGMAHGADYDRTGGTISLAADAAADVALVLEDDTVPSVSVVILDPTTDAELYRSPAPIPVQLGVS